MRGCLLRSCEPCMHNLHVSSCSFSLLSTKTNLEVAAITPLAAVAFCVVVAAAAAYHGRQWFAASSPWHTIVQFAGLLLGFALAS